MTKFIFLFLLVSFSARASIEAYNFGLIFGTANLKKSGEEQTHGSGLTLRTELFLDEDWGVLVSAGSSQTESDDLVGLNNPEFKYNTLQLGGGIFKYLYEYFRVAGGLVYLNIDEEHNKIGSSDSFKYDELGFFTEAGIKYPVGNIVVGLDYIYQATDKFKQSGIFLIFGLRI